MLNFFTLGNKYKKNFTVEFNGSKVFFKFFSDQSNPYVIDYHNGTYQNINSIQNGYFEVKKDNCNTNKISIAYNNYNIVSLWMCGQNLINNQFISDKINNVDQSNIVYYVNGITNIVLQQMRHLKHLNLSNNFIRYLILEKCQLLQSLIVSNNKIEEIDLSNNLKLKYLDLSNNKITECDLSYNHNLMQLSLYNNNLETINIPQSIVRLNLSNNNFNQINFPLFSKLKYLDISNNPNLQSINITSGMIQKIICKNTKIKSIDNINFVHQHLNPTIIFE